MKVTGLRYYIVGLLAAACLLFGAVAGAKGFPDGPITVIVPYPPGAASDLVARLVEKKISASLGVPVIVENRPGNAGNIGSAYVTRAKPDGHTILMTTDAVMVLNPFFYKDMPFNPLKDLVPITTAVDLTIGFAVNASLPVKSIKDLVAYSKQHPGTLKFGTAGIGTPMQIAGQQLNRVAGMDMLHVPYNGGGQVLTDLLGDHIDMGILALSVFLPHKESGRIRIIAIGNQERLPIAPDIPTVAETYPQIGKLTSWLGFYAPRGTPAPIVERLNHDIVAALNAPDVKPVLEKLAIKVVGDTPRESSELLHANYEQMRKFTATLGTQSQ